MNDCLHLLHPYPFEKLAQLLADVQVPNIPLIPLSIGEPKHPAPDFIKQAVAENFHHLSTYPTSKGLPELRQSIADWLKRRFHLQNVDAEQQVLP
ncbi:MAG: aminotransferase class I/II-fold pyridoxal phosphate-dependent enzyme, partial [Acinetobacter sp.]|nr:aminotransferase class I/II-fold pyridoxal phosphate-dependent enzyme [Acinetobacter sp.]